MHHLNIFCQAGILQDSARAPIPRPRRWPGRHARAVPDDDAARRLQGQAGAGRGHGAGRVRLGEDHKARTRQGC